MISSWAIRLNPLWLHRPPSKELRATLRPWASPTSQDFFTGFFFWKIKGRRNAFTVVLAFTSLAVSIPGTSFHPRMPPVPVIPISGMPLALCRLSVSERDRFLFSSLDDHLAHALTVQGWDILDGPPRCGCVHEGDRLVCRGSAAGSGAHLTRCSLGKATVGQQSPQRGVIVAPYALAQTHTELEKHNLIRVVTHP